MMVNKDGIDTGLKLNISEAVSKAVKAHHMTVAMVCKYLEIERSTYYRILQCKSYNFMYVIKLAQLFGCSIDDIVYNTEAIDEM